MTRSNSSRVQCQLAKNMQTSRMLALVLMVMVMVQGALMVMVMVKGALMVMVMVQGALRLLEALLEPVPLASNLHKSSSISSRSSSISSRASAVHWAGCHLRVSQTS